MVWTDSVLTDFIVITAIMLAILGIIGHYDFPEF